MSEDEMSVDTPDRGENLDEGTYLTIQHGGETKHVQLPDEFSLEDMDESLAKSLDKLIHEKTTEGQVPSLIWDGKTLKGESQEKGDGDGEEAVFEIEDN